MGGGRMNYNSFGTTHLISGNRSYRQLVSIAWTLGVPKDGYLSRLFLIRNQLALMPACQFLVPKNCFCVFSQLPACSLYA